MNDELRPGYNPEMAYAAKVATGLSAARPLEMICECYSPEPETIDVEQVLAAEMRQKVVEFDMFVPKHKPDIGQVVDVYVKDVVIKSIDVIPDRVILRGDLEVKVMYVAALPNEPVHAFEKAHVKFTRDIDVEGAMPEMKATADCTVEYVDYDFSDCEARKVHVTIVLKFWTRVTTTTELDIMDLMPPEEEVTVTEPEVTAGVNLSISGTTGRVTASRVNVRTGPGTNYPSVTKVDKGDVVTIQEQAFGWYKVVLPDGTTTGWIASWFIDLSV